MAKKTSGRTSKRAGQSKAGQPLVQSEVMRRVAETGGSPRAASLSEERARRANAASGKGGNTPTSQPVLTPAQQEKAAKGTPRPKQADPEMAVSAPLDHGALNHTREKAEPGAIRSEVGGMRREAIGSTPWPANIGDMDDREAAEAIRTTDKADILYKWRNDLRTAEPPRQNLVDLIFEKLLRVQGPPLPQEVL